MSYINFRTNDAVRTFTDEGLSEVEGLMCSAGMDDVGKNFRRGETTWVIT